MIQDRKLKSTYQIRETKFETVGNLCNFAVGKALLGVLEETCKLERQKQREFQKHTLQEPLEPAATIMAR